MKTSIKDKISAFCGEKRGFRFYLMFFLAYSALFLIGAALIYYFFHKFLKTFLWSSDGPYQHYASFNYLCDTLSAMFHRGSTDLSNLFPLNYTIGQGADILTTLNSYDYTDPISILCAFILPLSRINRFVLMIFIKLWMVGVAFSVFCFVSKKSGRLSTLLGALSYTFSGAILFIFARHPNYVNWAFFLPLLLAGAEFYRRQGRKYLLIITVCLNLIVNYYTFFINAVLLVVYVLVVSICEIIADRSVKTFKREFMTDLKLGLFCCLGILLAAVVLLPTLYAFLQNPRVGALSGYTDSMLHYEPAFYKRLFVSLCLPKTTAGYYSYIGIIPICLVAVISIFTRLKKHLELKVMLLLLTMFLCVPMAGRVLNGFGYATNRFSYAVPFFCSVIMVEAIPMLRELSKGRLRITMALSAAYLLFCFICSDISTEILKNDIMWLMLVTIIVLWLVLEFKTKEVIYKTVVAVTVLLSITMSIILTYQPYGADDTNEFVKQEKLLDEIYNDSSMVLANMSTSEDFFRVESKEYTTNVNGVNKINSTNSFWSLQPKTLFEYYNGLELDTIYQNCNFKGLGGRTSLLELASVKYYTAYEKDSSLVPYGYKFRKDLSKDGVNVYENTYALPIAYTYDSVITRETYDSLSAMEKQQAILQAAVVEEPVPNLPTASIRTDIQNIDYTLMEEEGAHLGSSTITVEGDNRSFTLSADIPENAEIYLRFGGIKVINPDYVKLYVDRDTVSPGYHTRKSTAITNLNNNWPVIRDGVCFNLGCGGAGENIITVTVNNDSEFTYDTLELLAIPMESYSAYAEKLKTNSLENSYVDSKHIEGDITAEKDSLLQFSVPYSIGFSAYVDGKKVDTVCTDLMYLSVPVSKGTHHVELRYATPYLKEGMIISAVTVVGLIAFEIIKKLIKKRKR